MTNAAAAGCVDFSGPVAHDLVREALEYSREKCGLNRTELRELLKLGSGPARDYLAYGIAVGTARFLGGADPHLHSVYLVESRPDGESLFFPLPLVFVVDRETAALSSLLDLLDRALLRECRDELGDCLPPGLGNLLNAHVVTGKQVEEGSGIAVLLAGHYNPPLTVWHRG